MRIRLSHGMAIVVLIVTVGSAQGPSRSGAKDTRMSASPATPEAASRSAPAKANRHSPYQIGTASWYGEYFDGRATASGEPFDMYDLTAAHPTLPLGTRVRVTNLTNGRKVFVRINDRGPIIPGRIIDLSYGAAQNLQFTGKGLQQVRLDLVSARETQPRQVALLKPVAY